ncbi:hypothetical protein HZS_6868, partial [Henneguya salminicola]
MESILPPPSSISIQALLFIDNEGKRIYSKFYHPNLQTLKDQKSFEKKVFGSTPKENYEIFAIETYCIVYRIFSDFVLYVVGYNNENQLFLNNVCSTIYESMNIIIGKSIDKNLLLDSMDNLIMLIDEVIDSGIVLELDPNLIVVRCFYGFDETVVRDP